MTNFRQTDWNPFFDLDPQPDDWSSQPFEVIPEEQDDRVDLTLAGRCYANRRPAIRETGDDVPLDDLLLFTI